MNRTPFFLGGEVTEPLGVGLGKIFRGAHGRQQLDNDLNVVCNIAGASLSSVAIGDGGQPPVIS